MAFLCRVCGKEQQTNHTGNWRSHYHVTHLTGDPVKCDICDASLKNEFILRRHKKAMHENITKEPTIHNCQICSQQFRRKIDVKKHIAETHSINPENITVSKPEPFKQKERDDSTLQPFSAKSITKKLHKKAPSEPHKKSRPTQASVGASNRNFICGMCYTNFKTKYDLRVHQESYHFHDKNTLTAVYNCLKCSKSFSKHIELTNHTIEYHGIEEAIPGATLVAKTPKDLDNVTDNDSNYSPTMVTKRLKLDNKPDNDQEDSDLDDLVVIIKEEDEDPTLEINIPSDERPPLA